ncbi:uncharacterized protein [Cicer arietinum]|uniref:Uncharacterized protein LOC101493255 n=1 Tax=Cicer arietinum TaxID=3827 RepID=A0A1S2YSG7_CICAR|nr:uncharacterized protein LOC101493255 [Cicer arietinum]
MAFSFSRSESTLTEKEKIDRQYQHKETEENNKDSATVDSGISSQLQLKSPSYSQTLDKHVVLRRIKQRKSYNKAKGAFEALLGTLKNEANTAQQQNWLQHDDTFSSP